MAQAETMGSPAGLYASSAAIAADRGVLRFITCGSVDDGKSTLIGRLLFDSKLIMEDTLATLARDSRKHGTLGEEVDLALLLDGLEAEREQGITIDVAYRFFATDKRKFIVADTPGHEQYTRNMATGASTADLAIILIDARKGMLTQTRRHSFIVSMLGIRHIILAVNKMDLVEYNRAQFHQIVADYLSFAEPLGFETITPIPISARFGHNVAERSPLMTWHTGPTLLQQLEDIDVAHDREDGAFRFPVQWVNRPNLDFRGYTGTVASGAVSVGDELVVAKSGKKSKVSRIVTADADISTARAGDAVTLLLEDEIDIARGDLLAAAAARPEVANQFAAHVLWLHEDEMAPGRTYLLKAGPYSTPGSVTTLKHKVDINTMEHRPGKTLALNEIGLCNIETNTPIAFDPYKTNRETGGFILVDRFTNATVGAGMIAFALRRAGNIHSHAMDVTQVQRSALKGHEPMVIWFTGLSGSGKSTIANAIEGRLAASGAHTYSLDGDNLRHGLNRDLGFTEVDRVENIRRIGEVAKLMADAGLIVTCSFISPFRSERQMVRDLVGADRFLEVFVDTPLEVCMARDPKGLYAKAKAGQIKNFTGIDSPYEAPDTPELHIETAKTDVEASVTRIVALLQERRIIR
jgi:bifunctional enzyme CysN/CysC